MFLIGVGLGISSPSIYIPYKCNPIASFARCIASSIVSPQVKHPGKSGNSTEIPSSSKVKIPG